MAWTYLAELEDSPWPYQTGSSHSPTVKSTDTLEPFYCRGCNQVIYLPPQSGMTLPRSYLACCPEMELTSSMEDSPVRTSALQDLKKAWKESEADYFLKLSDSLEKSSQLSFFSKTFQESEPMGLMSWSKPLPISAMIVDGRLYPLPKLMRRILEKDGGYLPTLTAQRYGNNQGGGALGRMGKVRHSLETMARKNLWPTLTVSGNYNRKEASKTSGDGLATAIGGQLSPTWGEWLMGYKTNWTELSAWAMPLCRKVQRKRLKD